MIWLVILNVGVQSRLTVSKQRAVINEGLRISTVSLSRFPRIAIEENLQYKTWTIPMGVSSLSSLSLLSKANWVIYA